MFENQIQPGPAQCLNGPDCDHVNCPEHRPYWSEVPLPEEGCSTVSLGLGRANALPDRPPSTPGMTPVERIELSLFRLAQAMKDTYRSTFMDLGTLLDKSLRGDL